MYVTRIARPRQEHGVHVRNVCMMALDIHASMSAAIAAALSVRSAHSRLARDGRGRAAGMTMGRTCESLKHDQIVKTANSASSDRL